ncbi:MAG TPA: rRNA adenine N-6-methyltransferase family protein [Stellaceae bacterium]|jgi:protein-L-isoaspartate(D-aspartate) O-methyltransferase|nr:rRNA adenine N-6-methyltransferase family protein [Stellaceae bacterium]
MDRETELAVVRRAYAKQVMAAACCSDRRVENAFAAVPREDFLGRGPWPILRWGQGYVPTPTRNPLYLYADVLVGIIPERNLNNGQPSFHAALLASAAPKPGEHAVHVGAGVGYFTAILAHLVGRRGSITAIEFDPVLAARATANFAGHANVRIVQGDGAKVAFDTADVIYVNAGATRPADPWLDRLAEGGRLILPLTADGFPGGDASRGAVFCIERRGDEFRAKWVSPVAIFPCEGTRDPQFGEALAAAFKKGGPQRVTRLYRRGDLPEEQCWLRAEDWCLAYE